MKLIWIILVSLFTHVASAQQAYLIQEVKDAISNLELINVTPSASAGDNCVVLDDTSDVPEILRFKTEEKRSCFVTGGNGRVYTGLEPGQHILNTQNTWLRTKGPLDGLRRGVGSGNYLLRRLNDRNGKAQYQAILNLNFTGSTGLNQYMYQKTKTCMKELSPFLKGPNGESLEVKIVTPNEKLPGLPEIKPKGVNVLKERKDYRGHAQSFGTNFSCTTIGHEILHHLGLCDEYLEQDPSKIPQASCRAVTAVTSFMKNMHLAVDLTVPQTNRCECGDGCQEVLKDPAAKNIYLSMNGFEFIKREGSLDPVCTEGAPVQEDNIPAKAFELASENGDEYIFNSYEISVPTKTFSRTTYNCNCPEGVTQCGEFLQEIKSENPSLEKLPASAYCPSANGPSELLNAAPDGKAVNLINGEGNQFQYTILRDITNGKPVAFKRVYTCKCNPAVEYCKKSMEMLKTYAQNPKPKIECPASTKPKIPEPSIGKDGETRLEGSGKNATLVIATPGSPEKSLLHPQQFGKILAGNCEGAVPGYETCESFSQVGKEDPLCAKKPAYCNDDNIFLGTGTVPQ